MVKDHEKWNYYSQKERVNGCDQYYVEVEVDKNRAMVRIFGEKN